jgi:hypothetical protein
MRSNTRRVSFQSRTVWALVLIVGLIAWASPSSAQNTAAFAGAVADDTGGVLPGVTVTLTGDALIAGPTVAVTDGEGSYRLGNLPPGFYQLTFELGGFRTVVREGLRLTVGFTAQIDATLNVGAVEESITVSGESPVVDIQQTATSIALTREVLETIPRGRGMMDAYILTPGIITSGAPAVGDSNFVARKSIINYGVAAQPKLMVEGINITTGADANSGVYVSYQAYEEMEMKASGNDAEVMTNGLSMTAIIKSGGNQFHGAANYGFQRPGFQGNNISGELADLGRVQDRAPLRSYLETGAELGGRIVQDRLWFFAAYDIQSRVDNRLGFRDGTGPDGYYRTDDDSFGDYTAGLDTLTFKLTAQATATNKFTFLYQTGDKTQPQNGGGGSRPLEATRDYRDETAIYKGGWQSTPSNQTFIEVNGGWAGYFANYSAARGGTDVAGATSRWDADTGYRTGAYERSDQRPRGRLQLDGSVSYLAGNDHEVKMGTSLYWEKHSTGILSNPSGNYQLRYDGCVGPGILPKMDNCAPDRFIAFNYPVNPSNYSRTLSLYLKDTWTLNDRLTANIGVRWDRQRAFLREQTYDGSAEFPTVFPNGTFPALDANQWSRFVPRVGVAYDVTGDGKTLLKATWGIFNFTIGDAFAGRYNGNSAATAQFRWSDPDGNNEYTPGEVNLDLEGADFISITAARNNRVNPDLQQPITYEATVGIERELLPGLGIRALYVSKNRQDYFHYQNVLRPYGAYSVQTQHQDPGPDGRLGTGDDGGMFTVYDYTNDLRGASNVATTRTNSDFVDKYQTIEFTLTKRASARWSAVASYWFTWADRHLDLVPDSPNNEYFNKDDTTSWNATASVSYNLPYDMTAALNLQSRSGVYGQRTVRFRAANLGNVTLRAEPYGSRRSDTMNVLSVRASKGFDLGAGSRAAINLDVFNLNNSSAGVAVVYQSGGAFNQINEILAPRIARLSFDFRF